MNHYVLIGRPGTGKTLWARQRAQKFPIPAAETAAARSYIYRVSGLKHPGDVAPPFRAPHHTVSVDAIKGTLKDGYLWRPGELSLAHGGTLFLDELPEFRKPVLEEVFQALRDGTVRLGINTFPAAFQLIAAMNPCLCGWAGTDRCKCSADSVKRYLARAEIFTPYCHILRESDWRKDVTE